MAITGTARTPGALAATLPVPVVALTGATPAAANAGQVAATLPPLAVALTGETLAVTIAGQLATTLPNVAVQVVGTNNATPAPQRTLLGIGLTLGSSAVTEVIAPVEDGDASVPLHVITPTVPAPTLTQGRPL